MGKLNMQQIREYVISAYEPSGKNNWRTQVSGMPDEQVMNIYNHIQKRIGQPLDGVRPPEDDRLLNVLKGL